MAFFLFLMTSVILFIRPAEINYALFGYPLFQIFVIPCILLSVPRLIDLFAGRGVLRAPAAVCFIAYFFTLVGSNVVNLQFEDAFETFTSDGKAYLYFILLLANVNTERKYLFFLKTVVILMLVAVSVGILDYKHVIKIDRVNVVSTDVGQEGETDSLERMGGTGLFGDPNDMASAIATVIPLSLFFAMRKRAPIYSRAFWLATIVPLIYGFMLTYSRGGMLALLAGLACLMFLRLGRRAVFLLPALPVLLMVVGGRQANISLGSGTGQGRIQLQHGSMVAFVHHPILGIGNTKLVDLLGHVAHNSFVQSLAETGMAGAACFMGAYYCVVRSLWNVWKRHRPLDPDFAALSPTILSVVAIQIVARMSLTLNLNMSTHAFLGIATVYPLVCVTSPPFTETFTGRVALKVLAVSLIAAICLLVYVNVMVKF